MNKPLRYLWIDDHRSPYTRDELVAMKINPNGIFYVCRTLQACVRLMKSLPQTDQAFDRYFLDHDLGPYEDVMMFLHWYKKKGFPTIDPSTVTILSANPPGAKNIQAFLNSAWKTHELIHQPLT